MKIPKTIKIGGHTVKIVYPYVFTERGDLTGQFDKPMSEIRIAKITNDVERSESEIAVTFLHEILHGVDYVTGQRVFDGPDGESKIEGISEVLFQVLRDNELDFSHEAD